MTHPAVTARVDVNLTWLAPGRVGGSEEYLCRQLDGLLAFEGSSGLTVRLFCQPSFGDAHPEFRGRVQLVPTPFRRDVRGARIAAEHTWLARRTRSADVVHHGGGTTPLLGNRSIMLTVHDLQYLQYPQYFSPVRREYLARLMPLSARRAQLIGVPSEFVRRSVIDALEAPEDRVIVVPHGVPRLDRPSDETIDDARARYGVTGDYVIYPAITHPHKGHRVLVDFIRATASPTHELHDVVVVLVGAKGAAESALDHAIRSAGASSRAIRTGRIPAADRDALVAGAGAVVFPSEYEGFGAPLVEAMDLGVPVVASAHPAIVEVCGDAALIVPSPEGDAWASAIGEAFSRRDELTAAGRIRRESFTLERSGVALAGAYRRIAESGGLAR